MLSSFTSTNALLPCFSSSTSQKVDAVLGDDLLLHCQIEPFGQHTDSWIIQKDLQILTVWNHKFTSDKRISMKHHPHNVDFMLLIKLVSEEDLGSYQCQLNTSIVKISVLKIRRSTSSDMHHTKNFS
jgi:hypothetical protein